MALQGKGPEKKRLFATIQEVHLSPEIADSASARSPHPPPQGEPPKLVGDSTTSLDQATSDKSSGTYWPQNSTAKHSLGSGAALNHAADGYQGVEVLLEELIN